ncbi:MAG: hypothetical protein AB8G11_05400 [Saprospiraceae bacterium]
MKLLKTILSAFFLTALIMLIVYFVEMISDNPVLKIFDWQWFILFSVITFCYLMWQQSKKKVPKA